ncbi:probable glycosyltransferase [Rhodococcus aetherivorans]|nr:probable glycosyltransferase [Rhodococcus aetherivorans]
MALEALGSGTPIVVSDQCASADELTAGGGGAVFTLTHGNGSLKTALANVERDKDARTRAHATYQQQYSEEAWIQRISDVYRRIRCAAG